jgi:hypothetical protein
VILFQKRIKKKGALGKYNQHDEITNISAEHCL